MRARVLIPIVSLVLGLPSLSAAQDKPQKPAKAAAGGVKEDPQGLKGISPFWQQVKKGDDLYVARDFEGAIAAYREAITKEPQNALGHYRIGEAHLAKNDTQEAESAWVAALRFVGGDHALKAKILFVLADLRERQKAHDDAKERWTAYAQFADQQPAAKGFPKTAAERKERIDAWKKISAEYAAVKTRIEARLKEADEKAKKDAQSGKNK